MNAFLLVDCNNFFCSCERAFDPKLWGRPVVVLSSNDGCVVARSSEVKALGVPMGAPYFKYREILTRAGAAVFSSNFDLYSDMSQRVMQIVRSFALNVEVYSIDEAFIYCTSKSENEIMVFAQRLKDAILCWSGIPVSIGIGATKTLAKVATEYAKKKNGIFSILIDHTREESLKSLPIEDVWGIGRKSAMRLRMLGIHNALTFSNADLKCIRQNLTVFGERIALELRGVHCLNLEDVKGKKGITSSRSFGSSITSKEELQEALAYHASKVAYKLRRQHSKASSIIIFIRTNRFRNKDQQYAATEMHHFISPTHDTSEMIRAAYACLDKIYRQGFHYYKVGVMLGDFSHDTIVQHDMFASQNSQKRTNCMTTIDQMNAKGLKVFFAAQGINKKWRTNCNMRSPRYTTHWAEIPIAKAI